MKIGLLVGTNRRTAMSLEMAKYYGKKLNERGVEYEVLDLATLPEDFAFSALYHNKGKNPHYNTFQERIDGIDKWFVFVPEYNGSFPGVLKTFFDGLRYPDSLTDKKVAMVGLANGTLGNAVGLGHLNDILSYMGANVLGLRVKLGEIGKYFDGVHLAHPVYERFITEQIDKLIHF
ncbi:NAD(P)H-dependent oxidoreductase [Marinilongibacter aquaticus]|uniref:NADPH-dependent FMN reductase n=1 Tax=Marinilongibacter aquaticus TaxID=2975157 RepID=UPI0021BD3E2F|nr:NAD(P)H-dependent oxidoreductase [Marinilongibacter aquaticus]UBM58000.1 NAD(P)H-dependent oxidoreductase [Marinilongibacter aquaticus]